MIETSTCTKCGKEQVMTDFAIDRMRKTGYTTICKKCRNARSPRKKIEIAYAGEKKCTNCNEMKLRSEFKLSRMNIDGHYDMCKACCNKRKSVKYNHDKEATKIHKHYRRYFEINQGVSK